MNKNAEKLLRFLVDKIKEGKVNPGDPGTYLGYKEVLVSLGLSHIADTYGRSLELQGLRELAEWIEQKKLPAITGLIVDKGSSMPSKGYFEVYGKNEFEFKWWEDEIRKSMIFDWDSILNPAQPVYPDEVDEAVTYVEGAVRKVTINNYERDANARIKCIQHFGLNCSVCGFNFEKRYGEIGKDFIHVHHLKPISDIKDEYIIDPTKDLRPVCPNCHAMLHKKNPPYCIEELKGFLKDSVKREQSN